MPAPVPRARYVADPSLRDVFRDSQGVVHTVCSVDPLADLPGDTALALAGALLRPDEHDLGGALEQCEAVRELLERWQDAFFAALPDEIDLAEEARWAAEAGLSLADVEASYVDDDEDDDGVDDDGVDDEQGDDVAVTETDDALDVRGFGVPTPLLDELTGPAEDDPCRSLPEELVALLERELLLLPMRVRLEALVAAADLVGAWADLFADHEKLLGHLVLSHAEAPAAAPHEELARRHAERHAHDGPHHPG